jgi:hypothetical protein
MERDWTMTKGVLAWLGLTMMAVAAAAQTTVTTSGGTTNTVPVFTGSATVGNSPISVSGSNVGIGITNPGTLLTFPDGLSDKVQFNGNNANQYKVGITPSVNGGDAMLKFTAGATSSGEFGFYNSAGLRMIITNTGNIGIGTANPGSTSYGGTYPKFEVAVTAESPLTVSGPVGTHKDFQLWDTTNGTGHIWSMRGSPGGTPDALMEYYYNGTTWVGPNFTIATTGNVGIGTTSPGANAPSGVSGTFLEVNGNVMLTQGGSGKLVFPDGTTQTTAFIPANCGADYAESVGVSGDRTAYEPGDILVIDPNAPGKFLKSNQAYSTLVAGIYSTKPGFIGRLEPASAKTDATEVPMAMVGRVPTKVSAENGPIHVGDLLVTSSTMGYAMKGTDHDKMLGAVVGKALAPLDSGTGVIMVLVNVQ